MRLSIFESNSVYWLDCHGMENNDAEGIPKASSFSLADHMSTPTFQFNNANKLCFTSWESTALNINFGERK